MIFNYLIFDLVLMKSVFIQGYSPCESTNNKSLCNVFTFCRDFFMEFPQFISKEMKGKKFHSLFMYYILYDIYHYLSFISLK